MLNLSKNDGTPIKSFDDYKALYLHIKHIKNMRPLPGHPEFGQAIWRFMLLSLLRVIELKTTLQKEYEREVLARTIKEGSGIRALAQPS